MSVSSHYSFILPMTEEVSFMRFGKHATPQRGARVCVQPCDPRENFFLFQFPFVVCIHAGGQGSLVLTLSNEAGYQRGKPGLIIRVYP